jgi:hypothetical protein
VSANEETVGLAVLAVELLEQVGVVRVRMALRVEPVAEHLDRAVEGDVLRDGERAHVALLFVGAPGFGTFHDETSGTPGTHRCAGGSGSGVRAEPRLGDEFATRSGSLWREVLNGAG